MSDLHEAAEAIRRQELRWASRALAQQIAEATPRTRHIPPPSPWPAVLLGAAVVIAGLIALIAAHAA